MELSVTRKREYFLRDVNGDYEVVGVRCSWFTTKLSSEMVRTSYSHQVRLSVFACTIIYHMQCQASAGDTAVTILKTDPGSLCSQILTQYPFCREVLCAWLHEVICIAGVLHSGGGKSGRLDINSGFSLHLSSLVSYDKFHITSGSFSRA